MTDCRKPRHDKRLYPCPICGEEPWADSRTGTIYCDCGLRLHKNGECHPEWHRMDWTADEWNGIAKAKAENDKLREQLRDAEHDESRAWDRVRKVERDNDRLRDTMYSKAKKHALHHMDEDELRIWATQQAELIEELKVLCMDVWRFNGAACKRYQRLFDQSAQGGQMVHPNMIDGFGQRMCELGIRVDE